MAPSPDQNKPELKEAYAPPRTSVEKTLVGIWEEVLKLERIGIHDDLFEIGGYSLAVNQIISRVIDAFQVEPSLRSIFDAPTIAALAQAIQQIKGGLAECPAPKI